MLLVDDTLEGTFDHDTCFLCGGSNRSTNFGTFLMIDCPNNDCSNHNVMTLPVIPAEVTLQERNVVAYQRKFRFIS